MTESDKPKNARVSLARAFFNRAASSLPPPKAHLIFWSLLVLGLLLDLWSKNAVFDWLRQRPDLSFSIVDGFFRLVMAENAGAAFGIAHGQTVLLVVFSVLALVLILVIFLFIRTEQRLVHIAFGLFAAGICGNLYDRIFNNGLVRDFIDIVYWPGRHWPAFNLADSMLCIAVALIVISGFQPQKRT